MCVISKPSLVCFLLPEPVRPGPADYSTTKAHMKKDPSYTVRQQTKPSYPESLNYVSKGKILFQLLLWFYISQNTIKQLKCILNVSFFFKIQSGTNNVPYE